jgi:Ohr subfamily peroxiredoxin
MNTTAIKEEKSTTPSVELLYTARTLTTGGRDGGSARSSDGRLHVNLSPPGRPGGGTNPEQLFAAGWSACFIGALKIEAGKMKLRIPNDVAVAAEVDLCLKAEAYFLKVRLNVSLPDVAPELARKLVDAAHLVCPYSKATRANIDVQIKLAQNEAVIGSHPSLLVLENQTKKEENKI